MRVAARAQQRDHRRIPSENEADQRRAYGFRNFENYRLRVIHQQPHFDTSIKRPYPQSLV